MNKGTGIFNIVEYRNPDFVVAEDKHGKFVLTPEDSKFHPYFSVEPQFPKRCYLTTSKVKHNAPVYTS